MNAVTTTDPAQEPGAHTPAAPVATAVSQQAATMLSRIAFGLVALVAIGAAMLVLALWQKVSGMQEHLARQSGEALAQSAEARALARQASDTVLDAAAKSALVETRVDELGQQRARIEELIQSLSRSRDEGLVVDMESTLRLTLQQARVTGNTEALLAALKASEQRLSRAMQPRLMPLQRAIQHDADRLRASISQDSQDALQRLDQLIRGVDDLPPLNTVATRGDTSSWQTEALPVDAPWWQRAMWTVRQEAHSLLRVSRIDHPEAVLLAPEQTYFLRENLKLKLLNARLALLSWQLDTARGELNEVTAALNRYFDPASRRTQTAATLLQQLLAQVRSAEPPQIDETLAALSAAAAGR